MIPVMAIWYLQNLQEEIDSFILIVAYCQFCICHFFVGDVDQDQAAQTVQSDLGSTLFPTYCLSLIKSNGNI